MQTQDKWYYRISGYPTLLYRQEVLAEIPIKNLKERGDLEMALIEGLLTKEQIKDLESKGLSITQITWEEYTELLRQLMQLKDQKQHVLIRGRFLGESKGFRLD